MHILIVSFDFCLESGGIQNTSYLLAEHLSKYAEITCFSCSEGHDVTIKNVSYFKSKFALKQICRYNLGVLKELSTIHKQKKIDYILCMARHTSRNMAVFKILHKIPLGILIHGNELIVPPRTLFQRIRNIGSTIALDIDLMFANQLFANSEYTKKLALKRHKSKSITIIHPPISSLPQGTVSNYKAHVLFSIGRLIERKGFHLVLRALPKVIEKIPDIRYILSGGGEYEQELKQLAQELGISKYVVFTGPISEEDKEHYYEQCGLLVMPSIAIPEKYMVEGFGIVFIEANSYGKFVIATKSGGIPDAVISNTTGFLTNEKNIDDISDAILRFYDQQFKYDPCECIKWARAHHISIIAYSYYMEISNFIMNNYTSK